MEVFRYQSLSVGISRINCTATEEIPALSFLLESKCGFDLLLHYFDLTLG